MQTELTKTEEMTKYRNDLLTTGYQPITNIQLDDLPSGIVDILKEVWDNLKSDYPEETRWVKWVTTKPVHKSILSNGHLTAGSCIPDGCEYILWLNHYIDANDDYDEMSIQDYVTILLHIFAYVLQAEYNEHLNNPSDAAGEWAWNYIKSRRFDRYWNT